MGIAKWAAVAVTILMGLANLGQVAQGNLGLRVLGPVLAVAALVAVFGVARRRSWGTRSVIVVGAVNVVAALVGAFVAWLFISHEYKLERYFPSQRVMGKLIFAGWLAVIAMGILNLLAPKQTSNVVNKISAKFGNTFA